MSPAKYDPTKALPLRVAPELREALDALGARLPAALRLPRNTVAALALARGLEALAAELERDPMALHRALAAGGAATPRAPSTSTGDAPSEHPPHPSKAPREVRARSDVSPRALGDVEAPPRAPVEAPGDAGEAEALRERWRRSGLGVTAFAARRGIARSILREWLNGAATRPATLAKIAAALDAEGK